MNTQSIVPAIIYCAKSTQDRHGSIPTQLEECREMAEREGWTVLDWYQDEGLSAYSGNRGPGLAAAREHAARAAQDYQGVCMLVAQAHDRFARGAGDRPGAPQSLGEIWHQTRRQNVHLRTVEDDEELRDEASVAAIGRRANIDSARKSKSVKKGMQRRREKGLHNGGPDGKYGYDFARDASGRTMPDQPMIPLSGEAAIVRRAYEQCAAGQSQRSIARELRRENVRTKRGGQWHQGTLSKVLSDPFYAGFLKDPHTGALIRGQHQPLVSEALWHQVEALRSRMSRSPWNFATAVL